jgi:hypothetical protein
MTIELMSPELIVMSAAQACKEMRSVLLKLTLNNLDAQIMDWLDVRGIPQEHRELERRVGLD